MCDKKGSMLLRKWCDKLGEKTERKSKVGVWCVRGVKNGWRCLVRKTSECTQTENVAICLQGLRIEFCMVRIRLLAAVGLFVGS